MQPVSLGIGVFVVAAVSIASTGAAHPMGYVLSAPVTYAAGHIVPNAGQATVSVWDDAVNPVVASYCQASVCTTINSAAFCATLLLDTSTNWNSAAPVTIVVDGGVLGGNINACSASLLNPIPGTAGIIDHS